LPRRFACHVRHNQEKKKATILLLNPTPKNKLYQCWDEMMTVWTRQHLAGFVLIRGFSPSVSNQILLTCISTENWSTLWKKCGFSYVISSPHEYSQPSQSILRTALCSWPSQFCRNVMERLQWGSSVPDAFLRQHNERLFWDEEGTTIDSRNAPRL
jgi:hypothetical protein